MTDENHLSKKLLTLRLTEAERRAITELGKIEGSESNAIRRAIKMLMKDRGMEIPPDLFVDREPGNRLPKQKGKENRHERVSPVAA